MDHYPKVRRFMMTRKGSKADRLTLVGEAEVIERERAGGSYPAAWPGRMLSLHARMMAGKEPIFHSPSTCQWAKRWHAVGPLAGKAHSLPW
jgi:hypothetical protein